MCMLTIYLIQKKAHHPITRYVLILDKPIIDLDKLSKYLTPSFVHQNL
jgi:hypothetical protein